MGSIVALEAPDMCSVFMGEGFGDSNMSAREVHDM